MTTTRSHELRIELAMVESLIARQESDLQMLQNKKAEKGLSRFLQCELDETTESVAKNKLTRSEIAAAIEVLNV